MKLSEPGKFLQLGRALHGAYAKFPNLQFEPHFWDADLDRHKHRP